MALLRWLPSLACCGLSACTFTTDLDFVGNPAQGKGGDDAATPGPADSPTSVDGDRTTSGDGDGTRDALQPGLPDASTAPVDAGSSAGALTPNDASALVADATVDASDASLSIPQPFDAAQEPPPDTEPTSQTGDGQTNPDPTSSTEDVTDPATSTDSTTPDAASRCESALLFTEDFESGSLAQWTTTSLSRTACQQTVLSSARAAEGSGALRSEITCAAGSDAGTMAHQHFGALQFSGDTLVPQVSNDGQGIDAPDGVAITFHAWVDDVEILGNGRWLSFLLLSGSCNWSDEVFSLSIDDTSYRLALSHTDVGGGSRSYAPNAPAVPSRQWVRVTAYVNYHEQVIQVWQDGEPVVRADFVRPGQTLCHIRVGAFASENNDALEVFLDEVQVWRLNEPVTDLSREPCTP